jgi:hypothetical protein
VQAFKKNFSCNGAIAKDPELGQVIQLSGDQRANVKDFLVDEEICGDGQVRACACGCAWMWMCGGVHVCAMHVGASQACSQAQRPTPPTKESIL